MLNAAPPRRCWEMQLFLQCRMLQTYLMHSQRFARCVLTWMFLTVLGLSHSAMAQDHVTQRSWVQDPSGQWTWPAITQQKTTPFEGTLSQGFGPEPIWLRLRIDPAAHPVPARDADRLVLRIRPVYLDHIQIFDPLMPHGLAGTTGDNQHPQLHEFVGLDFVWPIARGTEPRDIWLRVTSNSTRQIDVQVLNIQDLDSVNRQQQLVFAGYVGIIFVLAVWGLLAWLFNREHLLGAFGLKQLAALFFALGSLGYLKAIWPMEWSALTLDLLTSSSSIVAVSTAGIFHIILVREFKLRHLMGQLLWIIPVSLVVKLALLATGHIRAALQLNMLEVMLMPLLLLAATLLAQGWNMPSEQRPLLPRPLAIGFYVLLVVVLLTAALPGLGWINSSEVSLYAVQAHGLVTAFMVMLMLQYRAHLQQKNQRVTALALVHSQLQAAHEREIRTEQATLLAMLAHEIKTPLATMYMRLDNQSPGSEDMRDAIRDMNNVIERCVQTSRLSDSKLVPHIECLDLIDLVRDAIASCADSYRIRLQAPDQIHGHTDRQLLFIVLSNLLENACKYGARNEPIDVRLEQNDNTFTVEIANLPSESGWPDADKVFVKYYRSPHARRRAGTGLGLYLVRNLVQTLGGQVVYTPTEKQICFKITLNTTTP